MAKKEKSQGDDILNENTVDFPSNPSTLSPLQLADSSDPSRFHSHATSSRSFLGLRQLHTPLAMSHTTHTHIHVLRPPFITLCFASVMSGTCLTRSPRTRHAPETRALFDPSQCPSPLPPTQCSVFSRCSRHQQVIRKGLLKSVLHLPHHITSLLSIITVLLNFSILPL